MPRSIHQRYRRATLWACLAAGGTVLALLGAPLLTGLVYHGLDLTRLDLPALCEVRRELAQGHVPWLSPSLGDSGPLLLRPCAQLFYPLRWLLLPLPPDLAASLQQLVHLALAAAGTAWLGRSFGLRPGPAAAAGVALPLTGTGLDLLIHTSYFAGGAAYLTLVWAAWRRACDARAGRRERAGLAAAALGLVLVAEPQSLAIALGLAALESVRAWRRHHRVALWPLLRGWGLLAAAAGVALLPWAGFLAEAALGPRHGRLEVGEALAMSFDASHWPAALWSGALFSQHVTHASYWRLAVDGAQAIPSWNQAPYLGPLLVVSCVCGLFARRSGVLVVALLGSLGLALGDATPLGPALHAWLPPLGLFRYPQKYLVVTSLAAVLCSASCLQRLRRHAAWRRRFAWGSGALLVGQAVLLALLHGNASLLDATAAWINELPGRAPQGLLVEQLTTALLGSSVPLLAALALVAAVPRLRSVVPWLVVADLAIAGMPVLPLGSPLAAQRSPLAALPPGDDGSPPVLCLDPRVDDLPLRQRADAAPQARMWMKMVAYRALLVPELQACDGVISPTPYGPLTSRLNLWWQRQLVRTPEVAARALGCSHLLSLAPPAEVDASAIDPRSLPGDSTGLFGPLTLYALRAPLPAAAVAHQPRLLPDEAALQQALEQAASSDALIDLVDDPGAGLAPDLPLPASPDVELGSLRWKNPARAELELRGRGGAVLMLRQSYLVGWRAVQAGQALPVLRVAGQHLGVVVSDAAAGPVHLRYRSPHWFSSLLGACCGVALAIALVIWPRRARRR